MKTTAQPAGFGTFVGVFVPCILMLFGVIIFLRMGWITGYAGLYQTWMIITLSALITLLTALSMAAIATNTELGKGGLYYILSRSLGLEAGAALGLPLFIKQSLSVAFCTVGFAESLHDLMPAWPMPTIGIVTLILFTGCACFSLNGALKLQVGIFIALLASIVALFTGGEVRHDLPAAYEPPPAMLSFWGIFAIFFPAMTGMESSVSLSGDLRNPSRSLPLGTIAALLTAYAVYMFIPPFLVWHVPLEVLQQDTLVMQKMALFPSLIIIGIWAATLSSALGGLLGAPRTLHAIAEDGVVPAMFAKTYGPNKEPIVATLVTFVIALVSIYFGSVNKLAPMLTMICLICYGVLNFSAGLETLMGNPSWRPRFRVHWTISFTGALLCLIAMLMIDPGDSLLAFALVIGIYLLMKRRHMQTSWEDLRQGILLFISRFAVYRLAYSEGCSKSWRPHFLVFTKRPEEHSHSLVKFSQSISQSKSFLTMASFLAEPISSEIDKRSLSLDIKRALQEKNIDALVQLNHSTNISEGMKQVIEHYGIGPLVPNTIVFGGVQENSTEFASVLQSAYQKQYNLVILNDTNPASGDIHVWWDSERQQNGDFMLLLAYMLQCNPAWNKAKICLNAIVPSELQRQSKMEEFRQLGIKRRLPFHVQVYVSAHPEQELPAMIATLSKEAAIVFTGFRPPLADEPMDNYARYLKTIFQAADAFPPTALVLSSDHTPLEHIMQ